MVRSYFEDYESSRWQIIGLFTDNFNNHFVDVTVEMRQQKIDYILN